MDKNIRDQLLPVSIYVFTSFFLLSWPSVPLYHLPVCTVQWVPWHSLAALVTGGGRVAMVMVHRHGDSAL